MFSKLRAFFGGRPAMEAATQLPEPTPPKVRPGSRGFPSFFTSTKPDSKNALPRSDRRLANSDILGLRNGADSRKIIHDYVYASPDLSSAVWHYLRVGIPSKYTAIALSAKDGSIDVAATALLQQIISRMDTLTPYDEGYSNVNSLKSISESLAKELLMYGSMHCELVLDKGRLPLMLQPISATSIEFKPDGKGLKPFQKLGNDEIDLDIPTFFSLNIDQDLLDPYASSPLESAIRPTLFLEDFANDVHRVVKKVIHPRQKVKIDEEKFRRYLSPEAQNDAEKARAEMAELVSQLENQINGLRPEDALVYFDMLGFEVENASNSGLSQEYEVLQDIGNSRLATGAKTMGTVLGFQSGSSNIASSETMLFMKSATGAIKDNLDTMYSRIFTLALRLFGLDVVAQFRYADLDLRPEADLAAFRQTQQMMTLELLSLGLLSDEEASLKLTGKLPPAGFKPLSGTMFKAGSGGAAIENPSNSGSTLNQKLNPETPTTGRGQNKKASVLPLRGEA